MKLHTESIPGNIHQAATIINKRGWANKVISMSFNGGNYTVTVFCMPDDWVYEIRKRDPSYTGDIHHDDEIKLNQ